MVTSIVPLLIGLWMLSSPLLLAEELARTKPSVCKLCTTYATTYTYLNSTVHQATIFTSTIGTTYVYKGTNTVTRHDLTGTLYYNTTRTGSPYDDLPLSQNHTKTIRTSACTTTSICATSTPSDYPKPTYCNCKKTITTTICLPVTITTYGTTIQFLTTKTAQPTEFGDNIQITPYWRVATMTGIIHYNYTKTIYKSTATVTVPANPTNSDFRTFKLQAVNNPSLRTSPASYIHVYQICADAPLCSVRPWLTSPDGDASSGTVFTIKNGRLVDVTDAIDCGFYADDSALLPFGLVCGGGGDDAAPDAWVGHYSIDCFGYLRAYVNHTDTWGIRDVANGVLELYARPDPVHGYNDYGENDSPYLDERPQYVDLRVVPYGL